jgi:zinc protease
MRVMRTRTLAGLTLGVLLAGCETLGPPLEPPPPPPVPAPRPTPSSEPTAAAVDPLGQKPTLPPPRVFTPPAPEVFQTANGMTVWLLERHTLPMVSVTLSLPYGAASDPKGKEGVAHITADMLDEGAGKRNAVELSTAVNDLGAALTTGARADGTSVSLTVLKKNFRPALEIFSDVVTRPRFDPKEWKRVSALWRNDLETRAERPAAVARVVMGSALYGPESTYGHPADGLSSTAAHVDLPAVKAFYEAHFRPDRATLVVAGDVTRAELLPLLEASFGAWKAQAVPPAPEPAVTLRASPPRLVLVDRPGAPQSVIAVVREGVAAGDPRAPLLDLVNTALGGSFTSRLNQDLREEHGWSYGARSSFTEMRNKGAFIAQASVVTEATGQALQAMLADLDKMAKAGLTDEEIEKVKAQDRADLVQTYESVGSISRRLGALATLGLGAGFDAQASRARQEAPKAELDTLAAAVAPGRATIVVVGPREAVAPQLAAAGLGQPELWNEEGFPIPLGATPAPRKPAKPKKK